MRFGIEKKLIRKQNRFIIVSSSICGSEKTREFEIRNFWTDAISITRRILVRFRYQEATYQGWSCLQILSLDAYDCQSSLHELLHFLKVVSHRDNQQAIQKCIFLLRAAPLTLVLPKFKINVVN